MPIPPSLALAADHKWEGTSRLHLSWLPEDQRIHTSSTTLQMTASEDRLEVKYTWEHEGQPQTGDMVISADQTVTMSWHDSWHQSEGRLELVGEPSEDQVSALGSYGEESQEKWGWRITLKAKAENALSLTMTNIDPQGNEEWAVDAQYSQT
jgi:hypothetical protein